MNDPQIHRMLSDIEKTSEDDFSMLEECGAKYFATSDLLQMRGKYKEQVRVYKIIHKANILMASLSPLWLVVAGLAAFLELPRLVLVSLILFPLSLFLFFGIAVFLRQTYRSQGYLEFVGREIEEELALRKRKN